MDAVRTGRCACGAVSYEVRGPVRAIAYCHCESCRRQSTNYVAATAAPADNITISGVDNLTHWRATPGAVRRFCRICGSPMFWQRDGSASISIMAGSLDAPTAIRADRHIYLCEKGDYYDLADGLPQHDRRPSDG